MLKLALLLSCIIISTPVLASSATKAPLSESSVKTTDIQGWNNTKWGMTVSQVLKLYPEAQQISDTLLRIVDIRVGSSYNYMIDLSVDFLFSKDTGQLSKVSLIKLEGWKGKKDSNARMWEYLFLDQVLSTKYGPKSWEGGDQHDKFSAWNFKTSTIRLSRRQLLSETWIEIIYLPTNTLIKDVELL